MFHLRNSWFQPQKHRPLDTLHLKGLRHWFTIIEFKVSFSKLFPWRKFPLETTYSYKHVNIIPKCRILDSLPPPGGTSDRAGPKPGQVLEGAARGPTQLEAACTKCDCVGRAEPPLRRGRKSLPFVNYACKAFPQGKNMKKPNFKGTAFDLTCSLLLRF